MKLKEKAAALYEKANRKFASQFGFAVDDVTIPKIVHYLHMPKDSSSLAVSRILFGLAMLFDIPDERGGSSMDRRWGDARTCHFPLLPFVQGMPMPYMAGIYIALWFGAVGIMLGYKYRVSSAMFTISYWYLLLIEKSFWNNHSYLFGLVALLLMFTEANCFWSIDAYQNPTKLKTTISYWNYFILKYQFFILYFMAGMKKGTAEWLTGYSVQNLSEHWVFAPFQLFLTVPQIDFLIVHCFIFVFDLTIAIWMMYAKTRHVAMIFCALFHLMNSRLFRIGMFPWVCLATMPLFFPFDWPKVLLRNFETYYTKVKADICRCINEFRSQKICDFKIGKEEKYDEYLETEDIAAKKVFDDLKEQVTKEMAERGATKENIVKENVVSNADEVTIDKSEVINGDGNVDITDSCEEVSNKKKLTLFLIIFHVISQAFLPYSHFITKGYNNWTDGLYGYSWDMMVHTWSTEAVIVKVVDNTRNIEFYVDPYAYTLNDRWTRHGDMVYQYARCLRDNLMKEANRWSDSRALYDNISVYVDVWCSMNERFTQRLFDSKADLLKVDWSPLKRTSYLMPLLDEALSWRSKLGEMRKDVHSWSNYSDVIFLADFPGYEQEKYISVDLGNVTLTILEGLVAYQPEVTNVRNGHSHKLTAGEHIDVDIGVFHEVLNIGETPAYYMYTFLNSTEENMPKDTEEFKPKLPIVTELFSRVAKMAMFVNLIVKSVFQMMFSLTKCHELLGNPNFP